MCLFNPIRHGKCRFYLVSDHLDKQLVDPQCVDSIRKYSNELLFI